MTSVVVAIWTSLVAVNISVAEQYPTVGKETTIVLSEPTAELAITYQPDAPVARTYELATNGRLQVPWTPQKAGVVKIAAVGAEGVAEVSVKFDGTPWLGVAIMLGAGLILFGGASLCMYSIFTAKEEES